jgi:hypothetical protein
MKALYIVSLAVLLALCVAVVLAVLLAPAEAETVNRWSGAAQIAGTFVALVAGIIALAVADTKPKQVKISVKAVADTTEDVANYDKNDLHADRDLRRIWDCYPDRFKSYKVKFTIINRSGFTLKEPRVTFRLPLTARHPHEARNWQPAFHSNTFAKPEGFYGIQFGDDYVLSQRVLHHWNKEEEFLLWIRMVIDVGHPQVWISVNADNAEGATQIVQILVPEDH